MRQKNTLDRRDFYSLLTLNLKYVVFFVLLFSCIKGGQNTAFSKKGFDYQFLDKEVSFKPAEDAFNEDTTIFITCGEEKEKVYYTIDGSDPKEESLLYTKEGLLLKGPSSIYTVKAFCLLGDKKSHVFQKTIEIDYSKPDIIANIPTGIYTTNALEINLGSKLKGTSIYYTLDGSEPTPASTLYTQTIILKPQDEKITIKAIGVFFDKKTTFEASYKVIAPAPP